MLAAPPPLTACLPPPWRPARRGREKVDNHTVQWPEPIKFDCKTTTDVTGELNPVFLQISVRREMAGGKSQEKLGSVHINLAEVAGGANVERRCLLQAHGKKQGTVNCVLKVVLSMMMTAGDPCFKA